MGDKCGADPAGPASQSEAGLWWCGRGRYPPLYGTIAADRCLDQFLFEE